MPEFLSGQIERVTYHNPENGFAVLRVKVRGQQDLVTVLGNLTSVTAGEHLEASGRWVIDREHGRQLPIFQLARDSGRRSARSSRARPQTARTAMRAGDS